jgi:HEPN domain-containing protein
MSKLRQITGEDYPEAAEKHLNDSNALMAQSHYDGAAYLAGYVVECSLKTIIQKEKGTAPRIHDLNSLRADALRLAIVTSRKTAKYAKRRIWGPSSVYAYKNGGWDECIRYFPVGCVSDADAKAWLKEAEAIFRHIIIEMQLNGDI